MHSGTRDHPRARSDDQPAAGDAGALAALYDHHGRRAFALAYRIVGNPEDAEEVVQESFLTAWRREEQYTAARGDIGAWLLTIVRNRAIDFVRARRARPRSGGALVDYAAALAAPEDTGAAALRELDAATVRAAVAGLPPAQRDVVTLTYFDGLSYPEVAVRTGAPLGTVKGRMRLALERLRGALTPAQMAG